MKKTNIYCDYCNKITTEADVKIEKLNGFHVEIGYSLGGWGGRKNFVDKQTVEICNECFDKVKSKSKDLQRTIDYLKDSHSDEKSKEKEHIKIEKHILEIMDSELSAGTKKEGLEGVICNRFACASKIATYIQKLTNN